MNSRNKAFYAVAVLGLFFVGSEMSAAKTPPIQKDDSGLQSEVKMFAGLLHGNGTAGKINDFLGQEHFYPFSKLCKLEKYVSDNKSSNGILKMLHNQMGFRTKNMSQQQLAEAVAPLGKSQRQRLLAVAQQNNWPNAFTTSLQRVPYKPQTSVPQVMAQVGVYAPTSPSAKPAKNLRKMMNDLALQDDTSSVQRAVEGLSVSELLGLQREAIAASATTQPQGIQTPEDVTRMYQELSDKLRPVLEENVKREFDVGNPKVLSTQELKDLEKKRALTITKLQPQEVFELLTFVEDGKNSITGERGLSGSLQKLLEQVARKQTVRLAGQLKLQQEVGANGAIIDTVSSLSDRQLSYLQEAAADSDLAGILTRESARRVEELTQKMRDLPEGGTLDLKSRQGVAELARLKIAESPLFGEKLGKKRAGFEELVALKKVSTVLHPKYDINAKQIVQNNETSGVAGKATKSVHMAKPSSQADLYDYSLPAGSLASQQYWAQQKAVNGSNKVPAPAQQQNVGLFGEWKAKATDFFSGSKHHNPKVIHVQSHGAHE